MKTVLILCMLMGSFIARGTTVGLMQIKLPLYLHDSDMDARVLIADVPVVLNSSAWESACSMVASPYVPMGDTRWIKPHDVNLTSLYGIRIGAEDKAGNKEVTIDASAAKIPEGYPFTLEQVIDAVSTCLKLMHPAVSESEQKFTLKILRP